MFCTVRARGLTAMVLMLGLIGGATQSTSAQTADTGYEPPETIMPDLLALAANLAADDCDALDGLDPGGVSAEADAMSALVRQGQAHEFASILPSNMAKFDYFRSLVDAAAASGRNDIGGVPIATLVSGTDRAASKLEAAGGHAYYEGLAERLRRPEVSDADLAEARRAMTDLPSVLGGIPTATLSAHQANLDDVGDMQTVLLEAITDGEASLASLEESAEALIDREVLVARLDRLREDVVARTVAGMRDQLFNDCVVAALTAPPAEVERIVVERASFGPWNIYGFMTIDAPSVSHSAFLTVYLHGGDIPSVDGAFNFVVPNPEFEGYDAVRRGTRTDEMGSIAGVDVNDQNQIETTIRVFPDGEFGNMREALVLTLFGVLRERSGDGWTLSGDLLLPESIPADWAQYLGVPAEGAEGTAIGSWTVDSANRS